MVQKGNKNKSSVAQMSLHQRMWWLRLAAVSTVLLLLRPPPSLVTAKAAMPKSLRRESFLDRTRGLEQLTPSQKRSLIVGGRDVDYINHKNPYPYFAALDHFGGGILIAPDVLLTAGHVHPPLEQNVQVRLAHPHFTSRQFDLEPIDSHTYGIAAMVRHPSYRELDRDAKVDDFNLMILDGIVKDIEPVKLNRDKNQPRPGSHVTVVGFGSMSPDPATFSESSAVTLQEVQLTVLSQKECLQQSGKDPARPDVSYEGFIHEKSMFCTSGGPNNEKDGCAFDSGSPLIQYHRRTHRQNGRRQRRNRGRRHYYNDDDDDDVVELHIGDPDFEDEEEELVPVVVGLVSWGENCADPYFPAVNARVSYAMDWISKVVCELSQADPEDVEDFRCHEYGYDDDDDDYYWNAKMVVQFRNYKDTYTARSGTEAILSLFGMATLGLAAVVYRLWRDQKNPRRRNSFMRSSTRNNSLSQSTKYSLRGPSNEATSLRNSMRLSTRKKEGANTALNEPVDETSNGAQPAAPEGVTRGAPRIVSTHPALAIQERMENDRSPGTESTNSAGGGSAQSYDTFPRR